MRVEFADAAGVGLVRGCLGWLNRGEGGVGLEGEGAGCCEEVAALHVLV